jgi:hypothetical protein
LRVGQRDVPSPEIPQRETVTRGLGRAAPTEDLLQVPVVPLVAIEETNHLARRPERETLREPDEPHAFTGEPLRAVLDDLAERQERFGYLERDPAFVELGVGGEVRPRAVPQRAHDHLVPHRVGEAADPRLDAFGRCCG